MTGEGVGEALVDGLTVVVPHYGDPRLAVQLVAQIHDQPCRIPVEVVVCDDASPLPFPSLPGVEVVRRKRNGGFGAAVNAGMARARYRTTLVLNSDVRLPEGIFDVLLDRTTNLMPAVVAPTVVNMRGRTTGGFRFPTVRFQTVEWIQALGRWQGCPVFDRAIGKVPPAPPGGSRVVDWVSGEAMLLDTAAFRAVGGFDESYYMYAEEVDLQRRLRDAGVPAVLVDTPTLLHEGGASTDSARSRAWLTAARFHYARRWGGAGRLRTGLTVATLVNLAFSVARSLAGRQVAPWRTAREELRLIWVVGRSQPQERAR